MIISLRTYYLSKNIKNILKLKPINTKCEILYIFIYIKKISLHLIEEKELKYFHKKYWINNILLKKIFSRMNKDKDNYSVITKTSFTSASRIILDK